MIIALLFAFAWLKPLEDKPPGNDIIYLPNGLGINRYMFIGDAREIRAVKPHFRNDDAHSSDDEARLCARHQNGRARCAAGDGVFFLVEAARRSLPFYLYQQTFSAFVSMSQTCHQLTLAAHQNNLGRDDLFSGNNEIVSIPRLTHRRHDSLVDCVDGYLVKRADARRFSISDFSYKRKPCWKTARPTALHGASAPSTRRPSDRRTRRISLRSALGSDQK